MTNFFAYNNILTSFCQTLLKYIDVYGSNKYRYVILSFGFSEAYRTGKFYYKDYHRI